MRKNIKKLLAAAFAAAMVLTSAPVAGTTGTAYSVTAEAKSSTTIYVGGIVRIYVKNSYGSAMKSSLYSVSNKRIVSVKKSGNYFKVKGKHSGNATVTLKSYGRKYTFKIKVKKDYRRNVSVSTDKEAFRDGSYFCQVKNKNNFPVRIWIKYTNGELDDVYAGGKASFYHVLKHRPKSIKVERDHTIYTNTPKVTISNARYSQENNGSIRILFDASTSSTKPITRAEYLFLVKYADGSLDIVKSDSYTVESGMEADGSVDGGKVISGVFPLVGEVRCFK
ncbi:MAG: hypothetical protein IIU28_03070 [Lachnospiraceae bacterium]|nr:hypothetical protein [Lachnospiraceae bacterium]